MLRVVGASEHNLRDLTVEIPLRKLVVVTGGGLIAIATHEDPEPGAKTLTFRRGNA